MYLLALWMALSGDPHDLERGVAALEDLAIEKAVRLLETARGQGPYDHEDLVRLYEQLGVAYAYLGRTTEAMESFDMLLALDPGHAVSYTLSPKATFAFQRARRDALERRAPAVEVSWPHGTRTSDPLPLTIEVVADPKEFLKRARLYARVKGESDYIPHAVALPPAGSYVTLELPPPAPEAETSQELQLFLVACDDQGNEVFRWGSEQQPRDVMLSHEEPLPWYSKWWVWTIVGTGIATVTGALVYLGTHEPSPRVETTLERGY